MLSTTSIFFLLPAARCKLRQVSRICQVFARHPGSSPPYAGGHDRQLARSAVGKAGDDGEVAIVVGGHLLQAIDHPTRLPRVGAIDNAEFCHLSIVGEMVAQGLGQSKCPGIVKRAHEDSWAVAQIHEIGCALGLPVVLFPVGLQQPRHPDDRVQVVNDDGRQVVFQQGLAGGVGSIAQGDRGVLALIGHAEQHRFTGVDHRTPEKVERRALCRLPKKTPVRAEDDRCKGNRVAGRQNRRFWDRLHLPESKARGNERGWGRSGAVGTALSLACGASGTEGYRSRQEARGVVPSRDRVPDNTARCVCGSRSRSPGRWGQRRYRSRLPAKDFDAQGPLLEQVCLAQESLVDDKT